MAEALLGLAPAGAIDATNSKVPVSHADQLQEHLRHVLETKSSPTRTEHISLTFDVRPTVQFTIVEGDNDDAQPTDPALEGADAVPAPQTTTRQVRVHDAVMNQPQENPSNQTAVAKHIVGLLSAVDDGSWVVRDISKGPQGWTFVYICTRSFASWAEQNAKNTARPIVGEYSTKELDPLTANRPAFDCRGSITITFSKSNRSISVKVDHSPLHKTVGELMQLFQPPPRPVPVVAPPTSATKTPRKTPKKRKSQAAAEGGGEEGGAAGGDGAAADGATDADGRPKKTPRKRKSQAGDETEDGQPAKRRKKKSMAAADAGGAAGAVATADEVTQHQLDRVILTDIFPDFSLNVTPTEAARRRTIAIKLLSDGGVDPNTLSMEQLTIFSNQSPELQKESLAMLAQYGAERLRIVHPHKSVADTASSHSPQPPDAASSEPSAATPASKKRARRSKGNAAEYGGDDTPSSTKRTPKPKVSRGACSLCRGSKTKCDKAKPSCGPCQDAGLDCHYPLEVSRAARAAMAAKKSAETIPSESEDEDAAEPEEQQEVEEEEPDDIETIDYTSSMPVTTMLTPAPDTTQHDYFHVGSEFPALVGNVEEHGVALSSLNYPEPPNGASGFGHSQASVSTYGQAHTQPESTQARQSKTETAGRRALPTGPSTSTAAPTATSNAHSYATSWQTAVSESVPRSSGAQAHSVQQATPKQHRSHGSVHEQQPANIQDAHSAYNSLINLTTLTNAALQQQSASPVVQPDQTVSPAQVSPFQAHAQTAKSMSRADQRAQTRTPLAEGRSAASTHRGTSHNGPVSVAPSVDATSYTSNSDMGSNAGYDTYGARYSNNATEQENTRLGYEPYAAQNAAMASSNNTYHPQTTYGTRPSTDTRNNQSTQQQQQHQQQGGASYQSATAVGHGRKTPAHSAASSYADPMAVSNRQTTSLQSFNMRNNSNTASSHSRTTFNQSDKSYNDYSESKTRQQQTQQPAQQQQQQQQQHQSQQSQQSQQNWHGGYAASNNNSSTYGRGGNSYGGSSNDTASYQQQQQQQQQHGQLNLAGQGYGGGEGDYFDLLRNINNNTR